MSTSTDAFPNYFSGLLTLSAANTFTTQTITLPINRIGRVSGTKAVVLEFLWAVVDTKVTDFVAGSDDLIFTIQMGPTATGVDSFDNPDVLATVHVENHLLTSGATLANEIHTMNMQSADGHGLLVASENIHITGDTSGMGAPTQFHWRIYYRFVQIPAMEMMGILQSQMG